MDCLADGQGISTVASDQRGQKRRKQQIMELKKKGFSGKETFRRRDCTVATHRN